MQARMKLEAEIKAQKEFERLQYEEYKEENFNRNDSNIICPVCEKSLDINSLDFHECICVNCRMPVASNLLNEHREECEHNGSHENNNVHHSDSSEVNNLTKEQIENLPIMKYKEQGHEGIEEEKCIICMEKYIGEQKLRYLPCLHRYHVECIDPWLGQTAICPTCKVEVVI